MTVAETTAVAPASVGELAEAMRESADRGRTVGVRGGGSKLAWGGTPGSFETVVDTSGLNEVIEHEAGDLVVHVQAGVRLNQLQQQLAPAGQWLGLDPPEDGATIGGIVASAASGPRRLLYGAPRDLLIGITVVLADGTVAKAGGKVVKNVAGYDLMKLFTGSFGTLGVIAECVLRLHPVPQAARAIVADVETPAAAWTHVRALLRSPLVPVVCELQWPNLGESPGKIVIVVEGIADGIDARATRVAELVGAEVLDVVPPDLGARPWRPDGIGLKVAAEIAACADVLTEVQAAAAGVGVTADVASHAGCGVHYVGLPGLDPDAARSAVERLRTRLAPRDGSVVVLQAPAEVFGAVEAWGPVSGLALMRRVKDRFDPEHRMSPGRFVGGI